MEEKMITHADIVNSFNKNRFKNKRILTDFINELCGKHALNDSDNFKLDMCLFIHDADTFITTQGSDYKANELAALDKFQEDVIESVIK